MNKKWIVEKEYYRIKKNKKWIGIILKGEDILVLHQIYIHFSMRAPSIHEIYQMTYTEEERNSNWISNRLTKMVQSGLIERIKEKLSSRGQVAGVVYYHYRLNKRGYDVLIWEGILLAEETERLLVQSKQKNVVSFHNRAASYLSNMIFVELYNNDKVVDFSHVRGSRHDLLGISKNVIKTNVTGLIVPDWIYENNRHIVAIEVDTGSQRGDAILKKYRHYKKVAEVLGKTLTVVFAVADTSIMDLSIGKNVSGETRHKRIASLKDLFPVQNDWPYNLHIYVASANRVPRLVVKLLSIQVPLPIKEFEDSLDVSVWLDLMSERLPENKEILFERLDNVLPANRNRRLDGESVFQLRQDSFTKERHLVLFGEEGSVRSYQYIRNNAQLAYQYNANPRQLVPLMVDVIFQDKESAKEDIYGNNVYHSVYFRDLASLKEELSNAEKSISILKLISPFKKKEIKIFHKK